MQRRCSLLHLSQACRGMLQPHAMPGSNQSVLLSLQQWAQLHVACDMQARGAWQGCHSFHSSPSLADFITLNNISDNPGAKHQVHDLPACSRDIQLNAAMPAVNGQALKVALCSCRAGGWEGALAQARGRPQGGATRARKPGQVGHRA